MQLKGLLVAVVVLAALGGGVYWSNRVKEAEEKAGPKDAPPKILTIAEDQFKGIRIRKTGGETTFVEKSDAGQWAIKEPKPLSADQDAVGSMVSTLSSLTSDRLIEEKAEDLSAFGLVSPAIQVTIFKKDGKTEELLVGDDAPTGGSAFVKLKSDPRVFLVSSGVKSSVDKNSSDLRDKRLLTFDSDKLTRVELIAKGPAIEFGKNAKNEWQIVRPRPLRADASNVEELVRKLRDARMDTSEDAAKAAAAFASSARVATVNVTDAGGVQTIEIRRDKDKNYYAKSTAVEGIYKTSSDLGEGVEKDLESFRNKKLFDFGFDDPSKLTVAGRTYEKSGEKWVSGGKDMEPAGVQAVIDKLRDLSATSFPDTGAGEAALDVTVVSDSGKRTEKVIVMKQGAGFIARREGEPSLYQLDSGAVAELQKAVGEIKEAAPPKPEAKK